MHSLKYKGLFYISTQQNLKKKKKISTVFQSYASPAMSLISLPTTQPQWNNHSSYHKFRQAVPHITHSASAEVDFSYDDV